MHDQPRDQKILNLLHPTQEMSVFSIAETLKISESTVRRDLSRLAESGRIRRTHGGAVLRTESLMEASFQEKRSTAVSAKRLIAQRVISDIPAGCTLYVDAGTSCLEAARLLLARGDCRIFTNSLPLLVESCQSSAQVTALGGEVRPISRALIGPDTLSGLQNLRVDIALIGASGLHAEDGAFTTETMEAGVKSAAIQRADQAWLLADRSKWQHAAALRFAGWNNFSRWYTDDLNNLNFPNHLPHPALCAPDPS